MSIALTFAPHKIVNVSHPSLPGFELNGVVKNIGKAPLFLLGLSYGVRAFETIRLQTDRDCPVSNLPAVRFDIGAECEVYLPISFTRGVLDAIEDARIGKSEVPLLLTMHALAAVTDIPKEGERQTLFLRDAVKFAVTVLNPKTKTNSFSVSRDEWLNTLAAFKYSEVEIFELPTTALKATLPPDALELLSSAERCFRTDDWPGTLEKSRQAFEAVAKLDGKVSDLRAAYDKLWVSLIPASNDEAKRHALNDTVLGFSKFQHLGRHVDFPRVKVDRHDALMALRIAFAIFVYMGERADERSR